MIELSIVVFTLSLEHNGASVKDKNVVVKVQIPGALLVAKESTKLFEESTDLAFDHIRRQIRKYKSKLRQQFKMLGHIKLMI